MDSPNLESLDAWAFEPRRVDKPWGYELIWALTDVYCGKVLFVQAGRVALAAVPPREGRVVADPVRPREDRAGGRRRVGAEERGRRPGRRLPLRARHGAPDHRARGHDDPRGLDPASRRRRPPRGQLRPRRHLGAVGARAPAGAGQAGVGCKVGTEPAHGSSTCAASVPSDAGAGYRCRERGRLHRCRAGGRGLASGASVRGSRGLRPA